MAEEEITFKEIEYDENKEEFLKHLIEENKFLRGIIRQLASQKNTTTPLDPSLVPHEVSGLSEMRSRLEEHFNELARSKDATPKI